MKTNEISLTVTPHAKQAIAWEYLLDNKTAYIVYGGAAAGGKSWLGCEYLLVQCLRYPDVKAFMAREKLKTIKQSTLLTFFKVARHHGLEKDVHFFYHQQDSYISFPNGSRIDILELKYNPSDPMYEDLGSLEYTFGWIEEAGEIDERAFDTIKTRIGRHNNDKYGLHRKLLITCNPKKNWLYTMFYKPWKDGTLPKDSVFIQAFVDDNTFIETQSKQSLMDIKDPIKRQRLLMGEWEYESEAGTLMDYESILDMWTNTVEDSTEKFLCVDVARYGKDRTVFNFWKGFNLYKKEIYTSQGTDVTAHLIREFAAKERIPYSHIVIDEDGVGGGVLDQCRGANGFINNSTPLPNLIARNPELERQNFANLKTQCTFLMADMVNDHKIAITIDDEEYKETLCQELEVIRRKNIDRDDQRLTLVSKDEIKLIIGRSPDLADAFIMRMYFTLKNKFRPVAEMQERQRAQMKAIQSAQTFDKWSIL